MTLVPRAAGMEERNAGILMHIQAVALLSSPDYNSTSPSGHGSITTTGFKKD